MCYQARNREHNIVVLGETERQIKRRVWSSLGPMQTVSFRWLSVAHTRENFNHLSCDVMPVREKAVLDTLPWIWFSHWFFGPLCSQLIGIKGIRILRCGLEFSSLIHVWIEEAPENSIGLLQITKSVGRQVVLQESQEGAGCFCSQATERRMTWSARGLVRKSQSILQESWTSLRRKRAEAHRSTQIYLTWEKPNKSLLHQIYLWEPKGMGRHEVSLEATWQNKGQGRWAQRKAFGDSHMTFTHSQLDVLIPPWILQGQFLKGSFLRLNITPVGQTMVGIDVIFVLRGEAT